MFQFKLELHLGLLTATRTGFWSLQTVRDYEIVLRSELSKLHQAGQPISFIIDIRSSGAQARDVADALRVMVARLGHLHAHRTAVVTASGLAKLQAARVVDAHAQVFTSMILARNWALDRDDAEQGIGAVLDEPSTAEAIGPVVHVHGPSDVDVTLTAAAALETAKRINDAALDALLVTVSSSGR